MKVAILTTTYFPESNGASIRTEGIAEGLHAWGNEVIIIVPGKAWSVEKTKNATVYRVPVKKSRIANVLERYTKYNAARYKTFIKQVPAILKREHIDLIHTRQPLDLFLVGKKMQEICRIPWVAEAHKLLSITDYENKLISKRRYQKILNKEVALLNQTDAVVTMTEAGKQTLQKIGVKRSIIPIENSSSIKANTKGIFKFEKDKKYVLYAGSIREVEAIEELITTFANIQKRLPETRLIILGKGNIQKLKELTKSQGIEDKVLFLGEIPFDQIGYYYSNATLFMHLRPDITYHKDIVGLKFYDAIKCSLPMVVSDVGELGKWVKKEGLGLTFPSKDQTKVYAAVERLIKDKKYYKKVKQNTKQAAKRLNWKNTCKELNGIYKELRKKA